MSARVVVSVDLLRRALREIDALVSDHGNATDWQPEYNPPDPRRTKLRAALKKAIKRGDDA